MSQIKLTEFLDRNAGQLCPICKAFVTREKAMITFRIPPTEKNIKELGTALYMDKNLDVVDSWDCKFKYMDKCKNSPNRLNLLREELKEDSMRRKS